MRLPGLSVGRIHFDHNLGREGRRTGGLPNFDSAALEALRSILAARRSIFGFAWDDAPSRGDGGLLLELLLAFAGQFHLLPQTRGLRLSTERWSVGRVLTKNGVVGGNRTVVVPGLDVFRGLLQISRQQLRLSPLRLLGLVLPGAILNLPAQLIPTRIGRIDSASLGDEGSGLSQLPARNRHSGICGQSLSLGSS